MPNREKVVNGLKHCLHYDCCLDCPYDGPNCQNDVLDDALALLKEQEPVVWSYKYNHFICDNCGLNVNDEVYFMMDKPISFCPACGRKVKWDDI